MCCVAEPPAPHWVPDSVCELCSECGTPFDEVLRRRHHCRACGRVLCHPCSARSVALPGWGIEAAVRACDRCHALETLQLPMLLGGDLWSVAGGWTRAKRRLVCLDADQSALSLLPWDDEVGAGACDKARRIELARLRSVEARPPAVLALHSESETVLLEPTGAQAGIRRVAAWSAALSSLLSVYALRREHERLYGGVRAGAASPRTVAVSAPHLQRELQARQAALVAKQAAALRGEAALDGEQPTTPSRAEIEAAREEGERREEQRKRYREVHARMRAKYGLEGGQGQA